ncbi:MAG TPA: PadR family transcriptional regulator [Rhizomicrobium sp.]|jgi:PadR family transcriptional regulator PadR|nr:PadR family transcriptional regulator [Rhizomicrobium sp.]
MATNPSFMNGVPELLILRTLEAREMYGYELVQAIRLKTNQAIRIGEGVVYPALHALEADGMLKSRRKLVNGRTRVYYALTRKGEKHLTGLVRHWQHITDAIGLAIGNLAIGGTAHAATAL